MKIFSLLLAILILGQSLSVCRPTIKPMHKQNITRLQCSEKSDGSFSKRCCSEKKDKHSKDTNKKKGCCDEKCTCFTCVKSINQTLEIKFTVINLEKFVNTKASIVPCYHSFDFHPAIKNPPKFTI